MAEWAVVLGDPSRIECGGEVVAWLWDRKWERLLVRLAEAGGEPVGRKRLAAELWPGNPNGGRRLCEVLYRLKRELPALGAPEEAVLSSRHGIGLGPGLGVRVQTPVLVPAHSVPGGSVVPPDEAEEAPVPIEKLLRDLPRRQAQRCVEIVEQAYPHFWGPEREDWYRRIDAEYDLMVTSLEWAIEQEQQETALRIAGALWPYWYARSKSDAGWLFLERVLSVDGVHQGSLLAARCVHGSGALAAIAGDPAVAKRRLGSAITTYERLGNEEGLAQAVGNLAIVEYRAGDYVAARTLFALSLKVARRVGVSHAIVAALRDSALNEMAAGDYDRAESLLLERLELTESARDRTGIAWTLINLSTVAQYRMDWITAQDLGERALRIFEDGSDLQGLAFASRSLGFAAYSQGDDRAARALFETSLGAAKSTRDSWAIGESLRYLGAIAEREGDMASAADHYRLAIARLENAGDSDGLAQAKDALRNLECAENTDGREIADDPPPDDGES